MKWIYGSNLDPDDGRWKDFAKSAEVVIITKFQKIQKSTKSTAVSGILKIAQ